MSSESEQAVLGAVISDPTLALTLGLTPEDFGSEVHSRLWGIALDAVSRGGRLDLAVVAAAWPKMGTYLQALADSVAFQVPGSASSHAATVKDAAVRRRLKALGARLMEEADDPESKTEEIAAETAKALATTLLSPGTGKRAVAERVAADLRRPPAIYPTGMVTLDMAIGGGLVAGKLYGIAARKKVGKTSFLGTISHNLNVAGTKHLFIALEMSPVEIEQRNMAREFGINSVQFLKPTSVFLERRVADYATTVPDHTVYEHAPGMSLDALRSVVTRAVLHHRICGVILDYWQLVGGKAKNETEEYHLRCVAQWLADTCRKEGLWCLIAAQVNQDGNTRGGEGLKLACDVYFTLHRDKDDDGAWLEMEESRYVLYANVGSEQAPGLRLDKHGPHFVDVAAMVPG